MNKQFLICFSGLPGVGKTTIAKQLAKTIRGVFLRVDTIEKPIMDALNKNDIGPLGYTIIADLARENIELGSNIIIDCVNPLQISRQSFRSLASQLNVPFFDIEVQCQNKQEHKRRIETRHNSSVKWSDILNFVYEKWDSEHLILDSFEKTPEDNVAIIVDYIKQSMTDTLVKEPDND